MRYNSSGLAAYSWSEGCRLAESTGTGQVAECWRVCNRAWCRLAAGSMLVRELCKQVCCRRACCKLAAVGSKLGQMAASSWSALAECIEREQRAVSTGESGSSLAVEQLAAMSSATGADTTGLIAAEVAATDRLATRASESTGKLALCFLASHLGALLLPALGLAARLVVDNKAALAADTLALIVAVE